MKTKQTDAVRFYTRRDSATAVLRKLGIKPRDYDYFIEQLSDGRFACKIAIAELHLQDTEARVAKHKATNKKVPRTAAQRVKQRQEPKKPKGPRVTISSLCRDMILDGKSNEEIFKALQKKFGKARFDDSKRHYPAWYRCELRRNHALPPAFDTPRQDRSAIHRFED